MKLEISKTISYVPNFSANRELSVGEQIVVEIANPTIAEKNKIRRPAVATARTDKDGRMDGMEIKVESNDREAVMLLVRKITGLSYEDGSGNETFIRTGKELVSAPIEFEPLVDEIARECNRVLDGKINEKN